ncbi:MAG: hypothetical protein K1X74_10285 [Pirellulales bacterium]|nr:hypothetical protein [Pirellulales bacterium]
MNCDEFELRLQDTLDERRPLEAESALRGHARSCPACHELMQSFQLLLEGVRRLEIPTASPTLATRVLVDLRREELQPRSAEPSTTARQTLRWAMGLATVAAVVALAAWLSMPAPGNRPERLANAPQTGVAQNASAPAPVTPATADSGAVESAPADAAAPNQMAAEASLRQLIANSGEQYEEFLHTTGTSLSQLALLLPGALATSPQQAAPQVEPAADSDQAPAADVAAQPEKDDALPQTEWVEELGRGLRPVRKSTEGAFSFLLDLVPEIETPPSS